MNCCNHDCVQGRICPARVKVRYFAAEALPPSRAPAMIKRGAWVALGLTGAAYGYLLLALVIN